MRSTLLSQAPRGAGCLRPWAGGRGGRLTEEPQSSQQPQHRGLAARKLGPRTLLGITGLLGPFSAGIGKAGIAISSQAFVQNLKGNTYYLVFHKGSDHEKIITLSAHDQGGGSSHKSKKLPF